MHGAAYISDPHGKLTVHIADPEAAIYYHTEGQTLDYVFCLQCGVVTHAISTIEGTLHAVINARACRELDFPAPIQTQFDQDSEATKLARRARHWIPNVTVTHDA